MTADELIRHLQKLASDTRILVESYETGFDEIVELQSVEVFRYPGAQEWDGEYQSDPYFRQHDQKPFPAVMIRGRRGHLRRGNGPEPQEQQYALSDLVNRCDPDAPVPRDLRDWDSAPQVGLEQPVMEEQVDIREAVLLFAEKVSQEFDVDRIILFGCRARDGYRPDSEADVAVILRGAPGDFVETKLAMAAIAYDVRLETDAPIQAYPIWTAEWNEPEGYSNPALLRAIQQEGITLWLREDTTP